MLRVSKYLLSAVLAVLFVLMVSSTAKAQSETSSVSEPVQVACGAYVLRISNVSPQAGSAEVDMWVWFRWKDDNIRPDLTFEITNGVITSRTESEPFLENDYNLASVRVQAKIFHDFDVNRYPLDNHTIHIKIEDALEPNEGLVFTADQGSALDSHVKVAGWAVALKGVTVAPYVYKTSYGSLGAPAATAYSRIDMAITLDRQSYGPLFKSYWISGLAVILALMSLLLSAKESSARYGMVVGAIFAASANAINISSQLPPTTAITLAEQINLIAVGVIFACVFASVFSTRLMNRGRPNSSQRLDRIAIGVIGAIYFALNFIALSVDINAI